MQTLRIPPSGPFVSGLLTLGSDSLLRRAHQHDFPAGRNISLDGTNLPSSDLDSPILFTLPAVGVDLDKLWWRFECQLRSMSTAGEISNWPVTYQIQLLTAPATWTTIFNGTLLPFNNIPISEGPLCWEFETDIVRHWNRNVNATVAAGWVAGANVGVRVLVTASDPAQVCVFGGNGGRVEFFELIGAIPVLS